MRVAFSQFYRNARTLQQLEKSQQGNAIVKEKEEKENGNLFLERERLSQTISSLSSELYDERIKCKNI